MSSTGRRARMRACMASTVARVVRPVAMSGWLVTTMTTSPASRRRRTASSTPGSSRKSSSVVGATGRPSRSMLALMTPSRSTKTARLAVTALSPSPLGRVLLQLRVRHQAVPDHRLERLRVRRDALLVHGRDRDDHVAGLSGIAAVAADDAEYLHVARLRLLDGGDDVGAHVLLQVAAADREHQDGILRAGAAHLEPFGEHGVPAFVVGARGKLGHVVGRRVGLDAAQLAEVVGGVAAV